MAQFVSHWTDFHEIFYWRIFRESRENSQVSLNSERNIGYFTSRPTYIYDNVSLTSSWNEKCFRQKFLGQIKTPMLYLVTPLHPHPTSRKSCLLRDVEKYGRGRQATDDKKIWLMGVACWITKATDAYSEYVIPIAFPRQR
jgi:hypothetical protein